MTTVARADLAWFPLVPRPRPPGLPLKTRIAELSALAASAEQGTGNCEEGATRAAEVLNKAALIASDCGVPALARELCRRQYELFAQAAPLPAWTVRLAMQPVLNIPRQLIRNHRGDDAHAMLEALHDAARKRTVAVAGTVRIDFAALTSTTDGHREACTLTWTALLADGTRALAQAGRWQEAAARAAAHRGTGARLLDGRQAAILALLADGRADEAAELVRQSAPAESWEHTVQAVLRMMCRRAVGLDAEPGIATMTAAACALARSRDSATAVARTRIGLTALGIAGDSDTAHGRALREALIATASADAYAARDLLASPQTVTSVTAAQRATLQALIRTAGLGAGTIPAHLHPQLADAADQAAAALTLTITNAPRHPPRSPGPQASTAV